MSLLGKLFVGFRVLVSQGERWVGKMSQKKKKVS